MFLLARSGQVATIQEDLFAGRFSTLLKLKRVIAYCIRFKENCIKSKGNRTTGPLTILEPDKALVKLIKLSQHNFQAELDTLSNGECLNAKNRLIKLNPFVDVDGILRVGGRLANSSFEYDKKFPILLSSEHYLAKLLFNQEHIDLLRAGPQHLLASVRERYWPLQSRNLARKTAFNCIRCFRAKPRGVNPIMGNLPAERTIPSPPFYTTAVDYAGPFFINSRSGRGSVKSKCYIGLFVCFSTHAVYLELITDLTKEAFIAALRRFIGRRSKPNKINSDNGTCFVGA